MLSSVGAGLRHCHLVCLYLHLHRRTSYTDYQPGVHITASSAVRVNRRRKSEDLSVFSGSCLGFHLGFLQHKYCGKCSVTVSCLLCDKWSLFGHKLPVGDVDEEDKEDKVGEENEREKP